MNPCWKMSLSCWVVLAACAVASPGARAVGSLGQSDRPEAYFNGSSYIRLSRPISLKQLVGLSFRTCVGGELFSQRYEGYTLHVTAVFEQVVVSWARPSQPHRQVGLAKETFDNRWHSVGLRYNSDPPSLLLEVDNDTQIISNVTWNPELLFSGGLEAGGAVLLVGYVFSGCIREGPQLKFHAASAQTQNVVFGHCPLTTNYCIDRKDVQRIQSKDHCYNELCMPHGTCISRHDRSKPCVFGQCLVGRATYHCECTRGWGGQNCSVPLTGCRATPCRNNGTCRPWLRDETQHRFNCSCTPGHYGSTCEKITTMSLEKSSYIEVNTSREVGYDISFRFRTTLGNGLLAIGRGLTYFFLELSDGRLNLHSSLLNKWEGVSIGSNLNDSNWQKVFVTINASHVVLAANEEQTIYPISQNEYNSSVTSFPSTRLGAYGSSSTTLRHIPNFFVGCLQDVVVNEQWVLPEDSNESSAEEPDDAGPLARAVLHGVLARCRRTLQCHPNPCCSDGVCQDAWTSYVCTCPRPFGFLFYDFL